MVKAGKLRVGGIVQVLGIMTANKVHKEFTKNGHPPQRGVGKQALLQVRACH